MRFERWGITIGFAIAQLAVSAALFAVQGTGQEAVRLWIHVTAWMSASFFLLAFSARPLRQFLRVDFTRVLLKNRRYVGVSGAFAHFIHGIGIVWLLTAYPSAYQADLVTLVGGGLGFVFYFAMALTSSDAAVAKLGLPNWKRLHTVGVYYVWFIFTFTFLGTVGETGSLISGLFLLHCAAVLALRIATRVQKRSAAAAA